jgi:hypothetical protein
LPLNQKMSLNPPLRDDEVLLRTALNSNPTEALQKCICDEERMT